MGGGERTVVVEEGFAVLDGNFAGDWFFFGVETEAEGGVAGEELWWGSEGSEEGRLEEPRAHGSLHGGVEDFVARRAFARWRW